MANNRFIFDTNTLINALLIGSSTSDTALRLALEIGEIVTTKVIRLELADVFLRSKFDRYADLESRIQLLALIEQQFVEWEGPTAEISLCRDSKDNKFLELAAACDAACIITGDKDLLILHPFRQTLILNPTDFLTYFKTATK